MTEDAQRKYDAILARAKVEADDILSKARAKEAAILQQARENAHAGIKKALAETGTWIEVSHHNVNPLVARVQRTMCVQGKPGRRVLDAMLGTARECYCCSAIRGFLYGVLSAASAGALVLSLL